MRIAEDARRCVVFFGSPTPGVDDDLEPWGTGFLLRANDDKRTCYLVTAAHVVSDKLDCPFAIRFNDRNNGSALHHVDAADWHFHPSDVTVDVAVLEIEPPDWADYLVFPEHEALSDYKFASKRIGPGDIVYTVGLWSYLRGRKRNKPFVHVGHIGMVPEDDRIPVKNWIPGKINDPVEVEAYLTEGEPLFGASGSPVFVSRSVEFGPGLVADDPNARTWEHGSVWLLGLHSDSYFSRATIEGLGHKAIPRGVNIVVPSMKIREILEKPELKKKRVSQMHERQRARRVAVLPEKTGAPPATDENPTHQEDFTRLLGAAARTRTQED